MGCYIGDDVDEDCCNKNGGHYYDETTTPFGTRGCCDDPIPSESSPSSGCPKGDDLNCTALIATMSAVAQSLGYGGVTGGYNYDTCHCDIDCDDKNKIKDACLAIGGTYDSSGALCGCKNPCDLEMVAGCLAEGCTVDPLTCNCDCDSQEPSEDPCEGVDCGCGKCVPGADGKSYTCDCGDCEQAACRDGGNACALDCTLCELEGGCGPCGTWGEDAAGTGCACTCSGNCEDGNKCVSDGHGQCKCADPCKNFVCIHGSNPTLGSDGKCHCTCSPSKSDCGGSVKFYYSGDHCSYLQDCPGIGGDVARGDKFPEVPDPYHGDWDRDDPYVRA